MRRTAFRTALAALAAGAAASCAQSPQSAPEPTAAALTRAPAYEEDIDALNGFTRVLIDSAETYGEAAEIAKDSMLKAELAELSESREAMVAEFQQHVAELGGTPDESGGAIGTSHRAFLSVRAAFDDNTRAAVAETLRAEEFLVSEAERIASDGDVTEGTRAFVSGYVDELRDDRDGFAALKARINARLDAEETDS